MSLNVALRERVDEKELGTSQLAERRHLFVVPAGGTALSGTNVDMHLARGTIQPEAKQDSHSESGGKDLVYSTEGNLLSDQAIVSRSRMTVVRGDKHVDESPKRVLQEEVTIAELATPRGFALAVNDISPALHRLAGGLVGQRGADDVVQEVLLRAWKSLQKGSFRAEAKLGTWLYTITLNEARRYRRRAARHQLSSEGELDIMSKLPSATPDNNPSDWDDALEAISMWEDSLPYLPQDMREVLLLRNVYDLPFRSVAERLGPDRNGNKRTESAAKVLHHRALKLLADVHFETERGVRHKKTVDLRRKKIEV